MPYVCKFCKGRYCAAHRLPENHNCAQLGTYKDRVRSEIGRVVEAFQRNPALGALFGSYDAAPAVGNFISQYKNLFHHYVHQNAAIRSSSFWSGFGAIRREVFERAGGFSTVYRRPSVEDIELGYRLWQQGIQTQLVKDLQVTHLFQRKIAIDAFAGSIAGATAAAFVLLLLSAGASFAGELTGGATLGALDLVVLALLPLALTIVATWVARTAVLAALRQAL